MSADRAGRAVLGSLRGRHVSRSPGWVKLLWYGKRVLDPRLGRYREIYRTIHARRCRTFVEIGTFDGTQARKMIETAALRAPVEAIRYFGFDLFERLTAEDLAREFSKAPPAREAVRRRLERTGARAELFAGYTHESLPPFVERAQSEGLAIDLIFIDGGHSVETIAFDWSQAERLMGPGTVVLFDDYYRNPPNEVPGVGCQALIDGLDRDRYRVRVYDGVDRFAKSWGTLAISLARVERRS